MFRPNPRNPYDRPLLVAPTRWQRFLTRGYFVLGVLGLGVDYALVVGGLVFATLDPDPAHRKLGVLVAMAFLVLSVHDWWLLLKAAMRREYERAYEMVADVAVDPLTYAWSQQRPETRPELDVDESGAVA